MQMFESFYWHLIFVLLMISYLFIQLKVKAKRTYFVYFLSGSVLGFYFDFISFSNNYYSYPDFYGLTLFGLPITMTLAEGFSVAITMFIFENINQILKADFKWSNLRKFKVKF